MPFTTLTALRAAYLHDEADALSVIDAALARSNSNASRNVYLSQDLDSARSQASALRREDIAHKPLWGVPVSLKDCFDLTGHATTCGSHFYKGRARPAPADSAVAARLRTAGAVITGKTHMHQLAFGITGENPDFGDCLQPRDPTRLTGGSSSGAAASVQEGSAVAAIGTDTGGSIRVPAALCGLAGYRSSLTRNLPPKHDLWDGGAHLSPTFDTLGWLYRNLADGPALGAALFDLPIVPAPALTGLRIGVPNGTFFHDCDPDVLETQHRWQRQLLQQGVHIDGFDSTFWEEALSIFFHIQATEAAFLHRGHYEHFDPVIAERLSWGASITEHEHDALHHLLGLFREQMTELFTRFDYLLLPCAPMSFLAAGGDHSKVRLRILRYTAPISAAGLPVVALPGAAGGLQLVGPLNADAELLALSAALADLV
jgi:aspartyl-tRNA(Asn)/glutamyl-tRNA(Gln) amidotransferase subunit A